MLSAVSKVEVEANTRVFLSRALKQQEARGSLSLWRLLLFCFGSAYFQVPTKKKAYVLITKMQLP